MRFEEFLMKLESKLRGITRKIGRTGYYFTEEDLYQEAVIYLWELYRHGQTAENTDSFLLQGCYFHLKNFTRTHHRLIDRCRVPEEYFTEDGSRSMFDMAAIESKTDSLTETLDEAFIHERLARILNERECAVVSMLEKGMTCRAIGYVLGISHVMVLKIENEIRDKCAGIREEIYR